MFPVHMHEHRGRPVFNKTDLRESAKFVRSRFLAWTAHQVTWDVAD
jgi:hypothetical protein